MSTNFESQQWLSKTNEPWCGAGTSNDNKISREVAKSLWPTHAIVIECIPLEKGCVESACIVDKLLKILQGNLGNEGRASQVLEKLMEKQSYLSGVFRSEVGTPLTKEIEVRGKELTLVTSHEWVLESEGKLERDTQRATTVVLMTSSELASGAGREHGSGEHRRLALLGV
jgi:hypothetical protein